MKFFNECDGGNFDGEGAFALTFDELTSDKTYYVYCYVYDTHGWGEEGTYGLHWAVYLGSETPAAGTPSEDTPSGNTPSESTPSGTESSGSSARPVWTAYEEEVTGEIRAAEPGATVVMDEGVTTLSNAMMKELLKKGDVSLKMEYTYGDKDYVVIIPAGAALDDDIPWYGPLYLAARYGNSLENAGQAAAGTYEVKSGDNLSRIAAACNMTLQELLAKNPQIKNPNKIYTGQKINR